MHSEKKCVEKFHHKQNNLVVVLQLRADQSGITEEATFATYYHVYRGR